MVTLISYLDLLKQRIIKGVSSLHAMTLQEIKTSVKKLIGDHLVASVMSIGVIVIVGGCIFLPPKGRIITIGPEMRGGLTLLNTTPLGKPTHQKSAPRD